MQIHKLSRNLFTYLLFFFSSREKFIAGPSKENGWLVLKTPKLSRHTEVLEESLF